MKKSNQDKSLQRSSYLYEKAPLWKALFITSYPLVFSYILLSAFFIITFTFANVFVHYNQSNLPPGESSSYVSRLVLQLSLPIYSSILAVSILVSAGFNIQYANQRGLKNITLQRVVFQNGVVFLILLNISLCVLLFFTVPYLFKIEDSSIDAFTFNLAIRFARILILGSILLSLSSFFLVFHQVNTRMLFILIVYLISGLADILMNYIFLGVLHYSIVFAAYSVVIAWSISALFFIIGFFITETNLKQLFNFSYFWNWRVYWRNIYLGLPQCLSTFGFAIFGFLENFYLSTLLIPSYANQTTHSYWISLFAILFPFINLLFAPLIGLNIAMQTFLSYCIGKKDFKRFENLFKRLVILVVIYSVIFTYLFIGLSRFIFIAYGVTKQPALTDGFYITFLTFMLFPLYLFENVTRLFFQVTHQKTLSFFSYTLHDCIVYPVFALCTWLLATNLNEPYVFYLNYPAADLVATSILAIFYFFQMHKVKIKQFNWKKVVKLALQ